MGARVVIIGGGFAGAFTAKWLRRRAPRNTQINLINADNYFVFQPLLPEVASGTINAPDAVTPLRLLLDGVRVRMAQVVDVDFEGKSLTLLQGSKRRPQQLGWDHLVLAVGQRTMLHKFPGLAEHSLSMRDLSDAHELRNKIIRRLEHADITQDVELKRRLLTFVVAGGGFSGVETIGELMEMVQRTLRFYPNIANSEIHPILVQRGERILPELPARLGIYAARALSKRGVEIRLNASIASATQSAVFLEDGSRIDTTLLVTTVGNGPHAFTEGLGLELEGGKIPVDACLAVRGRECVWALGDAALVPLITGNEENGSYAPPTAQFAVAEAKCLAANIARAMAGDALKKFDFRPKGSMASIGNYRGVAELFGIRITGLPAWILWRFLYIGMLPGFSTRLRVALNWLFDYFLPRSIVQIANRASSSTRYARYAAKDVVVGPGQIPAGFYTVVSGCLESRIPDPETGEETVRLLGPGDHWGERTISSGRLTRGTLTAKEDTRVLVTAAEDFRKLRDVFPAMDTYFSNMEEDIRPREGPR
ncbi:MAG: FAD-dependent oxidoreductase [Xanthomonadales bacterium]|nr:FAD-dependent oxidoreductase [Xanthomonadales bacterium]